MATIVKAPPQVFEALNQVKDKYHLPRLEQAQIAICITDAKPFRAGKINLGKVSKFSPLNKIWQGTKYDFCITLCADVWYQILNDVQRESLLDLLLTCCDVEYEPLTQETNGKKSVIKDEWGRVQYSEDIKCDDEGQPKWKVQSIDLLVFASNASRYNLWLKDLIDGLEPLAVNKKEEE
jgi:hypothetical protein